MPVQGKIDILSCRSSEEIRNSLFSVLESYQDILPSSRKASILIKPNLNSNMNALTGNTTDLRILSAIVRYLKRQGYSNITIGEGTNSGFYRSRISVISRLRVDALAAHYHVDVIDLNSADLTDVPFRNGVTAQVARVCVESDFFINVPKLKTHFEVGMSVCLKSLIGCLVGQTNKKKTHLNLAANIICLNDAIRPHLQIVDGLIAMEGCGPSRGTPVRLDTIIVGSDPYLIDLACSRIAGFDYRDIATLKLAEENNRLTDDHHRYVQAMDLSGIQRHFKPPVVNPFAAFIHHPNRQKYFSAVRNTPFFSYLASTEWFGNILYRTGLRQDVLSMTEMTLNHLSLNAERCKQCGICSLVCPLYTDLPAALSLVSRPCIQCMYCYMVCPESAIIFDGTPGFLIEQFKEYDHIIRNLYVERNDIKQP
jgi:uncharacterized protein (DUF362 family)/ferredoxin